MPTVVKWYFCPAGPLSLNVFGNFNREVTPETNPSSCVIRLPLLRKPSSPYNSESTCEAHAPTPSTRKPTPGSQAASLLKSIASVVKSACQYSSFFIKPPSSEGTSALSSAPRQVNSSFL